MSFVYVQNLQTERVNVAIISLHRRAALFDATWVHGEPVEDGKFAHQEEDTEGSIWSNEACLLELLYLLPIVTSRCPSLLTPGIYLSPPLSPVGLLRIFDAVCKKQLHSSRMRDSEVLIERISKFSSLIRMRTRIKMQLHVASCKCVVHLN